MDVSRQPVTDGQCSVMIMTMRETTLCATSSRTERGDWKPVSSKPDARRRQPDKQQGAGRHKTGMPLHASATGLIVPLISAERVPFAAAGWPEPTWPWPPAR